MCDINDYLILDIDEPHRKMLTAELADWHKLYLPANNTVVDLGAGCGESAMFFLLHGARHIVCVESDEVAFAKLRKNKKIMLKQFPNAKIAIIRARVDKIKIDIEGGEKDMVFETHFPHHLVKSVPLSFDKRIAYAKGQYIYRLVEAPSPILYPLWKIWKAHKKSLPLREGPVQK